jgi:hypothetical protein
MCVDGTTVAPGEQHEMLGRSRTELIFQMNSQDDDVTVLGALEGDDRSPLINTMKAPADPAGGVVVLAGEGFDLLDEAGAAANKDPQMYLGVFDDADCQTPSVDGTLDTAAVGTIDDGAGTNLLKVTPSAAGVVSVTLTATADGEFWLKAWPVGTEYVIDASDTHKTTFTP